MQYPKEDDKDGCMRIDIIEELIREVQEEEAMSKLQAKQASSMMQNFDEEVQKNSTNVQNFGGDMQKLEVVQENSKVVQSFEAKVQKISDEVQKNSGVVQKIDEENQKNKKLELKPLPTTLKYAFLDEEGTLPVIISSTLSSQEEEDLLRAPFTYNVEELKKTQRSHVIRELPHV
ncbi:hypothetical protein PIB30_063629 [Stylosanthes scabra]|uniref:Uncharacterized protein n=1 Tax=Stylosanthes scabra TaxID=79078 RepID=A0ABU6RLF3_9FABA|nr:hypothetical protein [Stylosanthes scabra]